MTPVSSSSSHSRGIGPSLPLSETKKIETPRSFSRSFEDQVECALDGNDSQLVQLLLGSKYCQLWQHWLAHATLADHFLAIKQDVDDLFLDIILSQRKMR